jgi:dTDP-4-amino-4,6-dideoxygalactose transaminase
VRVPLLDLAAQLAPIETEIRDAVAEVIASGQYALGRYVNEFEAAIGAYTGAKHAIGMSSGTDALLAALMALDVGPGDTVVTTPFSFFATASTIVRLGAAPVFVDIDPRTYNIDTGALQAWFERHDGPPPKAIIPVHLYGQCADMDAINAIADRVGVPVIEDAAQALGAKFGAHMAGTTGLCGTYSFYPTKNLNAIGDAGMAVTNDDAFAETLRKLRNHGGTDPYTHTLLGGNFRMDGVQAAALSVKLPHLDAWNEARRANAAYYDERFTGSPLTTPVLAYDRAHHCYHQYVVRAPDRRDELRAFLTAREIGTGVYYPHPLHRVPVFESLGYEEGSFPEAERAAREVLALPVYPEMTAEMREYVAGVVVTFFQ